MSKIQIYFLFVYELSSAEKILLHIFLVNQFVEAESIVLASLNSIQLWFIGNPLQQ